MRDSALTGIIAGVIGGIAYQSFMYVFYLVGISETTPFHLGAYILLRPGLDISAVPAQALGMVQHLANSSLLGLIAVYLLRYMGTDYLWLKGLAFGGVIYFLIYGVIAKAVIPVHILQPNLSTSTAYMFGNLLFGLLTTFAVAYQLKTQPGVRP